MFYDSRRSTVLARNGMVATSQPLAALAGVRQMMQGGNAVDAAVAAAAVLNVVEPVSTGVGGDMFALVWNNQEKSLRALNGSGRSPSAASLGRVAVQGPQSDARVRRPYRYRARRRARLGNHFGKLRHHVPIQVLQPAIEYAQEGFSGLRHHRPSSGLTSCTSSLSFLPAKRCC